MVISQRFVRKILKKPIEIYNEVTSQRRLPFKGTPLDPATPTTAPEQVGYDQTRRFWASLLTDYLRG